MNFSARARSVLVEGCISRLKRSETRNVKTTTASVKAERRKRKV